MKRANKKRTMGLITATALCLAGTFTNGYAGVAVQAEETVDMVDLRLEKTQNWSYQNDIGIDTSYVQPYLTEDSAQRYPELANALAEYGQEQKENTLKARAELKDIAALMETETDGTSSLSDTRSVKVVRADQNMVSLCVNYYGNYGGVHGNYSYMGVNFDTESGKLLTLTDVVSDTAAFFELVHEKLKTEYADSYDYMFSPEEQLQELKNGELSSIDWTVNSEGVTIYFNPYLLGPYAMGVQIITIYFDEAPELFASKYTHSTTQYVLPYEAQMNMYLDTDGDGEREKLELESVYDSDNGYTTVGFRIKAGEKETYIDHASYSGEFYILHTETGYYLYLEEGLDNDYSMLTVVDLKTMEYDNDKTILANVEPSYDTNESTEENSFILDLAPFYNPEKFSLGSRVNTLSTMQGIEKCHVGEDGYPVAEEPWKEIYSNRVLKLKEGIDCDVVDIDGTVIGNTTLSADSMLFFVRTGGESWIDMQRIDPEKVKRQGDGDYYIVYEATEKAEVNPQEEIYRFYLDKSTYPTSVNGVEEETLFEGIMYVG